MGNEPNSSHIDKHLHWGKSYVVSAGRTRSGTKTPLYGGVLKRTSSCARAHNDPRAEHLAIVSLSSESGFRLTKNRRSPAILLTTSARRGYGRSPRRRLI